MGVVVPKFSMSKPITTKWTSKNQELLNYHEANNDDPDDLSPWESFDLDWMSKAELIPDKLQVPSTTTQYEEKVYKQSITLLLRLQTNKSDVSASGLLEDPLHVGPWKVSRDSIPVLVGSLAGVCCLLLLGLTFALYICVHKRQSVKAYSIKREDSTVSSSKIPKSVLSLSRDSLVLVTGPSSGHQARIVSDPSNSLLFDYSFDFYFDSQSESLKNDNSLKSDNSRNVPLKSNNSIKNNKPVAVNEVHGNNGTLRRSVPNQSCMDNSSDLIDHIGSGKNIELTQKTPSTISASLDNGKTTQHRLSFTNSNDVRDDPKRNDTEYFPIIGRPTELDLNPAMSSGVEDCQTSRISCSSNSASVYNSDEALRTRSLPAWVRNKNRPLSRHCDLSSSMYHKGVDHYIPKRQRNRMGSDAAQLIALSKSRIRLLSPTANSCVSISLSQCTRKQSPFDEFFNDAVIVYNERTAL